MQFLIHSLDNPRSKYHLQLGQIDRRKTKSCGMLRFVVFCVSNDRSVAFFKAS